VIKLSIIIPCYNCEGTLTEAVQSIYHQEVDIPFDVIMVDDGSTDNTFLLMQNLAIKYPNIKIIQHENNLGGGAARNTAVLNSDGDIIFCLDSDDLLGPNFLKNITNFWLQKKCDGVCKSKSVMFNGKDTNSISYTIDHDKLGSYVSFESFFMPGNICPLTVTFLMTREAFYKIGGYPTNHGFDTQGFGFRFLANGLSAYICPDTIYYHRVNYHDSYYLREANSGKFNWNYFLVYDEFLYLFNNSIKDQLLQADLLPIYGSIPPQNILDIIHGDVSTFLVENYLHLIQIKPDGVAKLLINSKNKFDQYWLGNYFSYKHDPSQSLEHYIYAINLGFNYRIGEIKILQEILNLSGDSLSVKDELHSLIDYLEGKKLPTEITIKTALKIIISRVFTYYLPFNWMDKFKKQ
jgi:glycosyltransferase involved in cell wall biosynthesis